MKNKFIIFLNLGIFFFLNLANAESFKLTSKKIEIFEKENQVHVYDGKAISLDKNLEIQSDKFIYKKNSDILESIGSGRAIIKSKKIEVLFNNAIFNQNEQNFIASGNIKIFQKTNNFYFEGETIFYDLKNNIISSNKITKINDGIGNIHIVDSFIFEIEKDLIKVNNLVTKDAKSNIYKSVMAFINIRSNKIFGKDIEINLKNLDDLNKNNFRLKGKAVKINNNESEISKGIFTTCEKKDGCPPWQLSAKKITHNKNKKQISYDDALLKVYDFPIAYFPKFFHPDPTVKRTSGFLIPSLKNSSNSDNFLNIPFFWAISENKDATFSPRLYMDEKILLQTEFRQVNLKTNHIVDFSFLNEKNHKLKNHFFYEQNKNLILKNFDRSDLNLKLQKTSHKTYLKENKIKTQFNSDNNSLENFINLDLYSNDLFINFSSIVYENLSKNNSDKYEYIFPRFNIAKNLDNFTNLNGNFKFESEAIIRQFDTNILEKRNTNNFSFSSIPQISKKGFMNNYEFLIRNNNSENRNSDYKNKKNFYLSSMFQYNSNFPLIKENTKLKKILKPQLSLKVAPTHTKDEKSVERKIDVTNLFSMDRATDNTSVEGGLSAIYGLNYSILDKENNNEILEFKIANNLRIDQNNDLPKNYQIGDKTSNFFTETLYAPNELFDLKYISSFRNNFQEVSYENLISKFKYKNFVTSVDYVNENNTSTKNSYISNTINYKLDNSNSLAFSTRRNKTKDLTEYYNLIYKYQNDCLAASLEYNKDYYSDKGLQPDEGFLFKLTIIPFGDITSPNFKK